MDSVAQPSHYQGSVECIDAIRAALGDAMFIGYCRGNAIKYLYRAGKKGNALEDIQKAKTYLAFAENAYLGRDLRPALDGVAELIESIQAWQRETFPWMTDGDYFYKFTEEYKEIWMALSTGEDVSGELADNLICLFGLADRAGVDVLAALKAKHEINQSREWEVQVDGRSRHK